MNGPNNCHPERSGAAAQSRDLLFSFRAIALSVALVSGTALSAIGQQTTPPPANIPQSNPVAPQPSTEPPKETPTLAQQAQQE